jgi:hypothetical protein
MQSVDQLKELRKKAEDAVSEMVDGDLKTKAFEVILQHLLSTRGASIQSESYEKRPGEKKDAKASRSVSGAKSRIMLLKDEGFFTVPRSLGEVRNELSAHGWIHARTSLSGPLQGLVQERRLRRIKEQTAKQKIWKYVNP